MKSIAWSRGSALAAWARFTAPAISIDRPVAVKVLNPRFVEDEAARTRFRREAKAAGRLQHTNAVTVTDFGQSQDGYVYLVMELLEGRTLREVLLKESPLDTARAVSLMLQVSAAVAAAHEAGVIHRDLKPANIFIVQHPNLPAVVKVLDFGIAKLAAESVDDEDHKTLTQVGAMIGTPRYMSPEQCDGADLTPAADVYSLGVILYELLTGTVPFSGTSPLSIAIKHTSETPRSPSEFVSSIPPSLERLVLRALEKKPEDRPANAAEFRRELLEMAERLGLEHAAVGSGPDIDALRNVGTESPSGRLIIDISRLREQRATNSDPSEVTVVTVQHPVVPNGSGPLPRRNVDGRTFPKVSVPLIRYKSKKQLLVVMVIVAAVLLTGAGLVVRSRNAALVPNALVGPTPDPSATPAVEMSPSPSPTPSPTPKREPRKPARTKPQPKESFGSKVKKGVKKIFNPF